MAILNNRYTFIYTYLNNNGYTIYIYTYSVAGMAVLLI